jgi:hypothetical protein
VPSIIKNLAGGKSIVGLKAPRSRRGDSNQIVDYWFGGIAELGDFQSIATTTVGVGGTPTVTFSSIPSGYKHLQVRAFGQTNRGSVAYDGAQMRINGDTASNYSTHNLTGTGAAASSSSLSTTYMQLPWVGFGTTTGSNWGGAVIDILDYLDTNKYKTVRALGGADGNGSGFITLTSGNWRSTSAITSVSFTPDGGTTFSQYSSFALYGIKG